MLSCSGLCQLTMTGSCSVLLKPAGKCDLQRTRVAAMAEERIAVVGVLAERVLEQPEPDAAAGLHRGAFVRLHAPDRIAARARAAREIHIAEWAHVRITREETGAIWTTVQAGEVVRFLGRTFAELGAEQRIDEEVRVVDFRDRQKVA